MFKKRYVIGIILILFTAFILSYSYYVFSYVSEVYYEANE